MRYSRVYTSTIYVQLIHKATWKKTEQTKQYTIQETKLLCREYERKKRFVYIKRDVRIDMGIIREP